MALEERVRALIAVGAAIAANNPPEVKVGLARARQYGSDDEALREAIEIGKQVRRGAAAKTDAFAETMAVTPKERERGACRKGGAGRGNGQGPGCTCGGPSGTSLDQEVKISE